VWSIATSMLVDIALATIAYGIVMMTGAWLAGPTTWAIAVRRALAPYWREPVIAYTLLALIVAGLVWWAPTPAWRNGPMLLILVLLLAAGVEALRRQLVREFPAATRAHNAARRHERWTRLTTTGRQRGASLRESVARTASSAADASRKAAGARAAGPEDQRLAQLERLAQLQAAGILDEREMRAEKERILHDDLAATRP
jgi:hypothetical protein